MAVSVLGATISAMIGIIGLLIFVNVYSALNKSLLDSGTTSLLNIIPMVLGAVIVISIVAVLLGVFHNE